MRFGIRLRLALFALTSAVAVACGARSSLPYGEPPEPEVDAGPDVSDASDASDVVDAPPDVPEMDAPPIICDDAGVTFIYLITSENDLFSYYPPTNAFTFIGTIDCPSGGNPFSMGVDRAGKAYVLFNDGNVFLVSTKDASCETTDFFPGQEGFDLFGMGFSSNVDDPGETLYVARTDNMMGGPPGALGTIDVDTLVLTEIAQFSTFIGSAELTGTGASELYAFGVDPAVGGGHIAKIDKQSAAVLSDAIINIPGGINAWAFAFWGGDFYVFTLTPGENFSRVRRFHPDDQSFVEVQQLNRTIVGAGVSTCAPQ